MKDGEAKRFGPYIILGEIARGGQGVIMKARHEQLGSFVALKMLINRGSRGSLKHFRQEAKVLAELRHPNLLKVTDLGERNGLPYLAMEFVQGIDLAEVLNQRGVPEVAWTVEILGQVADALHYCHGRGIVHRDLKPANVLIEDATQRPILVDFGMVKRDAEQMKLSSLDGQTLMTKTGELKGTPKYMAPEQVSPTRYGPVTPKTDVYALGATLYTLLTGESPFGASSLHEALAKVVTADAPDPRKLNPSVPAPLAQLCLDCLAKQPADRPESAAVFAERLRAAAPGSGGEGPKRRSVLWISLAINALLLLAVGAGVLAYANRGDSKDGVTSGTDGTPPPTELADDAVDAAELSAFLEELRRRRPGLGRATPETCATQRDLALRWLEGSPRDAEERSEVEGILLEASMRSPVLVSLAEGGMRSGQLATQRDGSLLVYFVVPPTDDTIFHRWTGGDDPATWPQVKDVLLPTLAKAGAVQQVGARQWIATVYFPYGQGDATQLFVRDLGAADSSWLELPRQSPEDWAKQLTTNETWLFAGTIEGHLLAYRWADLAKGETAPASTSGDDSHEGWRINDFALTADGTRLWSVSGESVYGYNAMHTWDVTPEGISLASKQRLQAEGRLVVQHPTAPNTLLIGLNQSYELYHLDLASGERSLTYRADDLESRGELALNASVSHGSPLTGAVFSADGSLLFSISGHQSRSLSAELRAWDVATGKPRVPTTRHPPGACSYDGVVLSPDGRWLFAYRSSDKGDGQIEARRIAE